MQRIFVLAVLAILGGCAADGGSPFGVIATEDWVRTYVREQNAPIQAQVTRVEARVTQTDARVNQVAAHSVETRKVADDGARRAAAADARMTQALANRYKRTLVETISIRYAPGLFALTEDHKTILTRVLGDLRENPTYTLDIIGYTDASGGKTLNDQLSWRREEVVRRYLTDKAQVMHRISFIGLGEERAGGPTKDAQDRQVTIAIYKPAD